MSYDLSEILQEPRFDYLSADSKAFATAFDREMQTRGYASKHPMGDINEFYPARGRKLS